MTVLEAFLTGVISTASFAAGLFFFKFWRETRDSFFLLFASSFILEAFNRTAILFLQRPNQGQTAIYLVRLLAFLLILVAIVKKNYGSQR